MAPGCVDPGLRALLDDLARLDGLNGGVPTGMPTAEGWPPPGAGPAGAAMAPEQAGPPHDATPLERAEPSGPVVVVLPSSRPTPGSGPGWAEVVDLAAFRARRAR